MSETARKTGNAGWTRPSGPISGNQARDVLKLKELLGPQMSHADLEEAMRRCNSLLAETERVAEMETRLPVVILCASTCRTIH
jgi:hypothetical protein